MIQGWVFAVFTAVCTVSAITAEARGRSAEERGAYVQQQATQTPPTCPPGSTGTNCVSAQTPITIQNTAAKDSSDSGKGASKLGSIVQAATSEALKAAAAPMLASSNPGTVAVGVALMALAAIAGSDSSKMGKAAGDYSNLSQMAGTRDYDFDDSYKDFRNDLGPGFDTPPTLAGLTAAVDKTVADAKKMGYLDGSGNLTDKGRAAIAAGGSEASRLAADIQSGFDDAAAKLFASLEDPGARVAQMGFRNSGSGGEGSGDGDGDGDEDAFGASARAAAAARAVAKASPQRDLAGMSTLVGGTAIGVAGANIFEMIRRRYEIKRKAGLFVEI
jgi:hypothetical protein